ncbi:MAG: SMC-Scp complex subunit ScpB [Patescibacteria group bacterium]
MKTDNIDKYIESLLFLKGEPMSVKQLADILDAKEKEIENGLEILQEKLSERGTTLIKKEDQFSLATSPDSSEFCKKLVSEEFNPELTKASLEVLSIILYRGPISRPKVDYIRGVNSTFTLRNLMIRGLVERIIHPKDSRSFLYKPTLQLFQHLGVSKIEDLPEYGNLDKKIENFINENQETVNNLNNI